jgi:hypothetical protein
MVSCVMCAMCVCVGLVVCILVCKNDDTLGGDRFYLLPCLFSLLQLAL